MTDTLIMPPMDVLHNAAAELDRTAENTATRNAINKALVQMLAGCTPVATTGGFLVESRTSPGTVYRVSNLNGCGCAAGLAGRYCWHAATLEILITANSRRVTMPLAKTTAQIEREMDELFGY